MRTKNKLWLILSLLLISSMLLPGCSPQTETTPDTSNPTQENGATEAVPTATGPKILKLRLSRDISDLDPAFITGSEEDMVDRAVMEGLIRYGADGKVENQLVDSLTVSADGLTIDFKLREGIMWQRGYGELTAEDVKFSYERFIDPDLAAAYADDFIALDHVEVLGKYEGQIILKEPQATLFTTTLPMTSGLIVSQKYFEEVGLDKVKTDAVGTGPYMMTEWKPNEKIVLTRNPDYWGAPAYYDEIQIIPITDDKTAEIALESGELDFSVISLASADRFQNDPTFTVDVVPTNSYNWIGINVENPKLQDINVRKAILYGIDVQSILDAAYEGKATQARALIAPGTVGYWEDAPLYTRDVAKAQGFMDDAGLTTLDLNLAIQDTVEFRTWGEIVQANLAEIGINITIEPLDSGAFWELGAGDKGMEVELFAMGYSAQSDPAWFTMWFTCDQVGVWNWMRWCSPEFDAFHKEGIVTTDTTAREKIYIDMQVLWDESVNSVWITDLPVVYAYKPEVNPVIYPGGLCPMLREFTGSN